MIGRSTWVLATVVLAVCASAPANAELVRVPVAADVLGGVPATFEECVERVTASGYSVDYIDQPAYDPYYHYQSGATYGSISVTDPGTGTSLGVAWVEFDNQAGAEQFAAEMASSYGSQSYLRFEVAGPLYLQVYAYSYQPADAQALLDQLVGR